MDHTISPIAVSHSVPRSSPRERVATSSNRRQLVLFHGARLIACLDTLAAVVGLLAVLISVNLPNIPGGVDGFLSARITVKNVLLLILLATSWPLIFHAFGLYEALHVRRVGSEAGRLVAAVTAGTGLALVFPLTSVTGMVTVSDLRHFWVASLALCLLVRIGRRSVERARHRQVRRALVIGTGRLAQRAQQDVLLDRTHRYEVVGFVDEPTMSPSDDGICQPMIGTLAQLEQMLMSDVIDEVVIALPIKSCYQQIQHVISVCERAGVRAKYAADMFESTVAFPRYDAHGDRGFVAMHVAPYGYWLVIKRIADFVGAAACLIALSPLMLIVAAAIKLTSRGPVVYAQDRCGLNRRPFRMYKFRSMYAEADKLQASLEDQNEARGPVFKIRDDPRITPLGRVLRKTSLDELPQLWNVLRGDMSLVGPRPLPWRDVRRITRPSDMRRFSMRPGITCLWQIQGRSNIGFERWVELDLEYIDTWSFALDAQILVKTIPAVLSGDGAT